MRYLLLFLASLLFGVSINDYREAVGLNPLYKNRYLIKSAKLHTIYLYKNHIISHYENPNLPYFVGVTPGDRAIYSGYNSRYIIENLSQGENSYSESIKDLFSAIYHRLGFLDFNIDEVGFYNIGNIFVYEMGNNYINNRCVKNSSRSGFIDICKDKHRVIPKNVFNYVMKQNPKIVVWPYNGMKDVPAVFYDEIPDPLPEYGVCGYPISVSFNPYYFKHPKLIYFKLFDSNKEIKHIKIITSKNDVNHKLKDTQFVLFPLDRLSYGKRYYVKAKFVEGSQVYRLSWSFVVENSQNIIEINSYKQTIYLKPNKTYLIYFKPLNKNDKINQLRYSYLSNMKVNKIALKDANSVYLNISGPKGSKFKLISNKREITFVIE